MLEKILDCLNSTCCRATYKAVGDVIGVHHRNVRLELRDRCPRNSWVVNKRTGQPSGYTASQIDPRFDRKSRLLTTGRELRQFVDDWEHGRMSRRRSGPPLETADNARTADPAQETRMDDTDHREGVKKLGKTLSYLRWLADGSAGPAYSGDQVDAAALEAANLFETIHGPIEPYEAP